VQRDAQKYNLRCRDRVFDLQSLVRLSLHFRRTAFRHAPKAPNDGAAASGAGGEMTGLVPDG